MFIVMCSVSGGVTGSRQSELKGKDGRIRKFDSIDEANDTAKLLNAARAADRFSTAYFRYWVEEREWF